MKRNIDILKLIADEIVEYLYADDELCEVLAFENKRIEDLYDEGDSLLSVMELHVSNIEELLDKLTEDFINHLNCEGFECERFKWCVGKIRYDDFEIINYIETFDEMIALLDCIVNDNLRWYKMITQAVTDDLFDKKEVKK